MAIIQGSVAAATAVVGFDLLTDVPWARTSGADRVLREAGIAGSAAALDTRIDILIGAVTVGRLFNSATGHIQQDRDMSDFGDALIPAGEALQLIVADAPATNPINFGLDIEELGDV